MCSSCILSSSRRCADYALVYELRSRRRCFLVPGFTYSAHPGVIYIVTYSGLK